MPNDCINLFFEIYISIVSMVNYILCRKIFKFLMFWFGKLYGIILHLHCKVQNSTIKNKCVATSKHCSNLILQLCTKYKQPNLFHGICSSEFNTCTNSGKSEGGLWKKLPMGGPEGISTVSLITCETFQRQIFQTIPEDFPLLFRLLD